MFHPQGPTLNELLRQGLSSTERGYDLLAPKFDFTPFRTPEWLLRTVADRVAATGPVDSVLDICSGTGAAMQVFRRFCDTRIVGLDISRGMLEICRERTVESPGQARVELVRGNALAMPFDGEFDLALCFGALGHIPEADGVRLFSEIHRALRPGGRFVFVTSETPPVWSAGAWIARAFNATMRIRNAVRSPPFIMYYLRYLLPDVIEPLEGCGFDVVVDDACFMAPFQRLRLVTAQAPNVWKRSSDS